MNLTGKFILIFFKMKNQVQNHVIERMMVHPSSASKKKVSSSKLSMALFEVKELQIESKHDNE